MNKRPVEVINKFKHFELGEIGLSTITVSELQYGVAKSTQRELYRQRSNEFITPLDILSYDELAAEAYGDIRIQLFKSGQKRYRSSHQLRIIRSEG